MSEFENNGGDYINNVPYMDCKITGEPVRNVGTDVVSVIGNRALTIRMYKMFPETIEKAVKVKTGRPAGWHFMNEFVDKDGTVFHKGVEQPDLKGTLKPTKIKPKKKAKRRSQEQILLDRHDEKKQALKKAIKKQKDFLNHNFGGQVFERERLSLKRYFDDISADIQELRVILDELYMNEEFEDDNKWAYERVINSLDKLNVIRKDLEKLTERVTENNV